MDSKASAAGASMSTDEAIEKLQAAQRPSRHAPKGGDLEAWRNELERSARNWEVVGRKFMLKAEDLREKIRAVDVLLGPNRDHSTDAGTNALNSTDPAKPQAQGLGTPGRLIPDPDNPPDLRHTSVLAARFAGQSADGWNKLVHIAHKEAITRLGSPDALRGSTKSNFIVGRANSEEMKKGYRYVPEINISIQNVDAGHAWSNALRLARRLNVDVSVDFEWMLKPDAALPGDRGLLVWKSS